MLTKKQRELLLFINQTLLDTGISPSFDEMKEALSLKSKSGIHRLINGLEERGFIHRLPHRARALEVIRLPEDSGAAAPRDGRRGADGAPASLDGLRAARTPPAAAAAKGFSATVIRGDFTSQLPGAPVAADAEAVELPLYGRIAAGTPIEALRDASTTISIPAGILGRGEHYALEIEGDSMIEAGILDGDTVILERSDTGENGAIVVALIDKSEVTLKRLRRRGASIALEPANKAYETRIFGPDRVEVQGRLVALLRRY